MIDDRLTRMGEIGAIRYDVAGEMAGGQAISQVKQAIDHEQPGHQEMPLAAGPEILGRPAG